MEIWIRAQNREFLTKVNEIHLHEKFEAECKIEGFIDNAELTLGKYKSRERCSEIIDQINETMLNYAQKGYWSAFYEMPQE